jgi:hypothetical protein
LSGIWKEKPYKKNKQTNIVDAEENFAPLG